MLRTAFYIAFLAVGVKLGLDAAFQPTYTVHSAGGIVVTGASSGIGEHAAVVEDCCAALVIDSNYTKALIRRMTAHETLGQASLAALSLCMKEGAPFIAEVCAGARGSR